MRTRPTALALALLIAATAAALGCGGRADRVWVTGKVIKGGAKYSPPDGEVLSLTFIPLELQDAEGDATEGGNQYAAEVNESESTFEVPGPDRCGLPPGKYRVAVTQKLTRAAYEAARQKSPGRRGDPPIRRDTDMLANRFGPASSPIIVQIDRSKALTIDMDRPAEVAAE